MAEALRPETVSTSSLLGNVKKAVKSKITSKGDEEVNETAGTDDYSTSTLKKVKKAFKSKASSGKSCEGNETESTNNPSTSSLNVKKEEKSKTSSKSDLTSNEDNQTAATDDYSTSTLKKVKKALKSKISSSKSEEENETDNPSTSSLNVKKAEESKTSSKRDLNSDETSGNEDNSFSTLKKFKKAFRSKTSLNNSEEDNETAGTDSHSTFLNVQEAVKSKALSKKNSNSVEDSEAAGNGHPSTSLNIAKAKEALKVQSKKVAANVKTSASHIGQGAEKTTKALINTAETIISVAPERAEKIGSKLEAAASSAYEDTKHAISNPKVVMKEFKKSAAIGRGDMEKAMKTVKQNGQRFADEVDGAMEKLAAKAEEHFLPTSKQHLIDSEHGVLKDFDSEYEILDIEVDRDVTFHTICFEQKKRHRFRSRLPLVMIHGLGGGLPCFHKNYGPLCQDRKVYGIDLPGFALSSRVPLPKNAKACRDKIVDLLDKWRAALDIKKFILLGHSFGGHLAAAYTVKYHTHVRHLVLADPWGIIPKEEDSTRDDPMLWQKAAMSVSNLLKSNPFDVLRGAGPLGPVLADKFLPEDLKSAYGEDCANYFYHALAQSNATGEGAFSVLSDYEYLWPADAMKPHLVKLTTSVPMTFIYGETSPFHNKGGAEIRMKRKNVFVLDPLLGIGHHVQAQDPALFNDKVLGVLSKVDKSNDKCKKGK